MNLVSLAVVDGSLELVLCLLVASLGQRDAHPLGLILIEGHRAASASSALGTLALLLGSLLLGLLLSLDPLLGLLLLLFGVLLEIALGFAFLFILATGSFLFLLFF